MELIAWTNFFLKIPFILLIRVNFLLRVLRVSVVNYFLYQ